MYSHNNSTNYAAVGEPTRGLNRICGNQEKCTMWESMDSQKDLGSNSIFHIPA